MLSNVDDEIKRKRHTMLGDPPLNFMHWESIIDTNVVKSFWALPGSCKKGSLPYAITAKFTGEHDIFIHDDDDVFWSNPKDLAPLGGRARQAYKDARLDMFRAGIWTDLFVGDDDLANDRLEIRKDHILDSYPSEEEGISIDWRIDQEPEKQPPKIKTKVASKGGTSKDYVQSLLEMLAAWRQDDYGCWSKICWILKSMDEDYYDLFLEWSSDGCKFDENCCYKLWERAEQRKLGIGTLKYWAKNDNPLEYERVHCPKSYKLTDEDCRAFLEELKSDEVSER